MAALYGVSSVDGNAEAASFTHAAIASGDWAVVRIVCNGGEDEANVNSIELGGVAGTFIGKVSANMGFTTVNLLTYRFAGPIGANSSLVVDHTFGSVLSAPSALCSVTGAHASTPFGTPVGGGDTDGGVGASLTVPSDGLAISFGVGIDVPFPALAWANATERAEGNDGSIWTTGVATGTSGTPSVSFTPATLGAIGIISIPVSPAAGGGGSPWYYYAQQ